MVITTVFASILQLSIVNGDCFLFLKHVYTAFHVPVSILNIHSFKIQHNSVR